MAGPDRARHPILIRAVQVPPLALAVLFAAAAAASWPVVQAERRSAVAEAQAVEALGGPAPLPWEVQDEAARCDAGCPPRAAAAVGVRLAHEAAETKDIRVRLAKARQAQALLTAALKARPLAGEWWAWLAYARIGAGEEWDDVVQALGQSYRSSPDLGHLAPWRIGLAATLWPRLPADLQAAVVNEETWLGEVAPQEARETLAGVSEPAARRTLAAAFAAGCARKRPEAL
jgi:hypothetical protein